MHEASCHCGAVRITLPSIPETVTRCNCSICEKLGALWAYYEPDSVEMVEANQRTKAYIWGDKTIRIHHCTTCGCVTHWTPVSGSLDRMGINARMINGIELAILPLKSFDGAGL